MAWDQVHVCLLIQGLHGLTSSFALQADYILSCIGCKDSPIRAGGPELVDMSSGYQDTTCLLALQFTKLPALAQGWLYLNEKQKQHSP